MGDFHGYAGYIQDLASFPKEEVNSMDTNIPSSPLDPKQVKTAFKAFKKRLKLTQLDEDSKLGGGPMSGGSHSSIVAIQPPSEFSHEVWQELVRQGKLKPAGRGMFELVKDL